MLVTPNNPEVQEYFQDCFLLFSKIHCVTLESSKRLLHREEGSLSTQDFKANVIYCTKIILKILYNYFGNNFIQLCNISSYPSSWQTTHKITELHIFVA